MRFIKKVLTGDPVVVACRIGILVITFVVGFLFVESMMHRSLWHRPLCVPGERAPDGSTWMVC